MQLKEGAAPKVFDPDLLHSQFRKQLEEELDHLEAAGILEKISHADWAAPIVAVPKKDGKFSICEDYKVMINPILEIDQHPLPKLEELFATLAGGTNFTLDLSQAYTQIMLDDTTSQHVSINTHKGVYKYTPLPYGVASSPAFFQKMMEPVLQGIPNVVCYIDDILVMCKSDDEHFAKFEENFLKYYRSVT